MDNIRVLGSIIFLLDCELRRMEREGTYGFAHQGEQGELILEGIKAEMNKVSKSRKRSIHPSSGRVID